MTDKIVTHADRADLQTIRECAADTDSRIGEGPAGKRLLDLLDRLIAAAEADAPPLPEGWVLLSLGSGTARAYYHRGGRLRDWTLGAPIGEVGSERFPRDRLTPLRPTVTEADVERAAAAARVAWSLNRLSWQETALAAFKAAGIEVAP